jgi:hypothetical protein
VVHAHAAGIDVGNVAHYVAVRPERDAQQVRVLPQASAINFFDPFNLDATPVNLRSRLDSP